MPHRIPERLGRLAGQRSPGCIGDRSRDDDRQAHARGARSTASIANSAALALSVSKTVSTSKRSAPPSTRPSIASPYAATSSSKLDVAKAGIVDVGRDRRRAVGRAQRAGDEARLVRRLRGPGVGAFARDPGRREIDVAHFRLQPVVGLRDARRVEGVGLDDIGAGLEKGVVDRARPRPAASARAGRCRPSGRAYGRAGRTPARRESRPRRASQPGSSCPSRRRG